MSFARNFALGQQIAQTAIDAYDRAKLQRRISDVAEAKPVEIQNAYTSQDAEQLRALASARDAEGNPYYTLEANADGSYGLRPNFSYAGQDGQMTKPGGLVATFTPRATSVEFMGARYAPEDLDEDRIAAIRAKALADVISGVDPVRGLQMRRAIKSDERDDERFSWERQQQPLKQRLLGLEVAGAERTERRARRVDDVQAIEDEVARMSLDAIKSYASKLNTNQSQLPFLFTGATKDGYGFVAINPNTGEPTGQNFVLNEAQLRQLASAAALAERGFGQESIARLAAVNKDIADIVDRNNRLLISAVESQSDALAKQHNNEYRREAALNDRLRTQAAIAAAKRHDAALDRENERIRAAEEAAGLLQGYRTAVAQNNNEAANIYGPLYEAAAARAAGLGLRLPGLKEQKPPVNPLEYAKTLEVMREVYGSLPEAEMRAGRLFGMFDPSTKEIADTLRTMDEQKRIERARGATGSQQASSMSGAAARKVTPGFEGLHANATAKLQDVGSQLAAAQEQLRAAAKSQDQQATAFYSRKVQQLMRERDKLQQTLKSYTH